LEAVDVIAVEERVEIAAPPGAVWPLVDDVANLPRWFTFAEKAESLEGEGLGRRQRIYGRWGKKESEVDQRIVVHEPGRVLAWEHEAERLDGKPAPRFAASTRFTIWLEPAGEGSVVRLESVQEPAGPLRGFVMKLFGTKEIRSNLEASATRLKALAESLVR
jgi:uncharacterized membrane protein